MASFKIRNEWIIDQSNRVIAVNSGDSGDTRNTVEYAKKDIDAIGSPNSYKVVYTSETREYTKKG